MKVHVLTALGHFLSGIWDHPHVCGEKDALGMTFSAALGSPPRVWGKDLKISEKHCIILKYTVVRIRHLHL